MKKNLRSNKFSVLQQNDEEISKTPSVNPQTAKPRKLKKGENVRKMESAVGDFSKAEADKIIKLINENEEISVEILDKFGLVKRVDENLPEEREHQEYIHLARKATCSVKESNKIYGSENDIVLECDESSFRSVLTNLMLMTYTQNCPNLRRVYSVIRVKYHMDPVEGYTQFAFSSGEKEDTFSVLVEKSEFKLSDILEGSENFFGKYFPQFSQIKSNQVRDREIINVVDNALLQCISFLSVMHEAVDILLFGDLQFDKIGVAFSDKKKEPYFLYEVNGLKWELENLGFKILFYNFENTKVKVNSMNTWAESYEESSEKFVKYKHVAGRSLFFSPDIKFTESPGFLTGIFTNFQKRLEYWDKQLESFDDLPSVDLTQLLIQVSFYKYGYYSYITRVYIDLESKEHDRVFGNRKRVPHLRYMEDTVLIYLGPKIENFYKLSYYKSLMKEKNVSFTTSKDIIKSLIPNTTRNIIQTPIVKVLSNLPKGVKYDTPLNIERLSLVYGRGDRSVYIPSKLTSTQDTLELSAELARGDFNLSKLENIGINTVPLAPECSLCLMTDYSAISKTTKCSKEGEKVMPGNCELENVKCPDNTKKSRIGNLLRKDPFWIAGGKQGQVFKGLMCDNCGEDEESKMIPIAIKKFPDNGIELSCNHGFGKILSCSEYLNEVSASLVTSHFYDEGISPHFMKIYSVFRCDNKLSFTGKAFELAGYKPTPTTSYFMTMERIHGVMSDINPLISVIEIERNKNGMPFLGTDVYIHNCIAQVLCILRQYQEKYKGMHLDFHPGNAFLKLSDGTLYRDVKLIEKKSFDFQFKDGSKYSIPNIGITVKLGDLGHARMRPTKDTLITRQPESMGLTEEFVARLSKTIQEKFSGSVPGVLDQLAKFPKQYVESKYLRVQDRFSSTYDLGTFMNNMMVNYVAYNHPDVLLYKDLESNAHLQKYGDTSRFNDTMIKSVLFFLEDKPTAFIPDFGATFTTPKMMLEHELFDDMRVSK